MAGIDRWLVRSVPGNWVLLGPGMFLVALLGIATRPIDLLASFWPANAVLLGLMIRRPELARWPGWVVAAAGYVSADMVTGGSLSRTVALTAANLAGVAVGVLVASRTDEACWRLERPSAVLRLCLLCVLAAAAAGVAGIWAGVRFFGLGPVEAWRVCFSSELANYLALLPALLTVPPWSRITARRQAAPASRWSLPVRSVGLLVAAVAVGLVVGGPGAIGFTLPALLWTAIHGGVFFTALLTLAATAWTMIGFAFDVFGFRTDTTSLPMASIQIGLAIVSLGPVTVAAAMATRNEEFQNLRTSARRDALTGALNRAAFHETGRSTLERTLRSGRPAIVAMLDLDHFKQVNDRYGHSAGDRVLVTVVGEVRSGLRDTDLFGRLGGEEFALLMPLSGGASAAAMLERVRERISGVRVAGLARDTAITTSIGAVVVAPDRPVTLDAALEIADQALYRAKRCGRNRVVQASAGPDQV